MDVIIIQYKGALIPTVLCDIQNYEKKNNYVAFLGSDRECSAVELRSCALAVIGEQAIPEANHWLSGAVHLSTRNEILSSHLIGLNSSY